MFNYYRIKYVKKRFSFENALEKEIIMKKVLKLEGLECANCAAKMENGIKKIAGVESASISFISQKLTLVANEENMNEIIEQAKNIIKKIEPDVQVK